MKYLFDLDGTVTMCETLPLISSHFKIEDEIDKLTQETMQGNIPFMDSFERRVKILASLPVDEISTLLSTVPLYPLISDFIRKHKADCVIVTGNLRCWCEALGEKIGCEAYYSEALVKNNTIHKLTSILRKEQIVDWFKALGETVVYIGDGNNDLEAMRHADISIAAGLTHRPAESLYSVADYIIYNEKALCHQLNKFQ